MAILENLFISIRVPKYTLLQKEPKGRTVKASPFEDGVASSIPVSPHLGVLGRRWALRVVADIGFRNRRRFSQLLKSNPGMTPRMLSRRLKELERDGLIARCYAKTGKMVQWKLTDKGSDSLPAIMNLIAYGARWNANYKFSGKAPVLTDQVLREAQVQRR